MSRVGKMPVIIPEKVEVQIQGSCVSMKGPKGVMEKTFSNAVHIDKQESVIVVSTKNTGHNAIWGTTRSLIDNMAIGVSEGFVKKLEFNGVGYKVMVKGTTLQLNLGYSHPIEYKLPEGVAAKVNKNIIEISGIDKALIGFVAAKIKSFRPPDPYKGKGIKYVDEVILRKAGKAAAKAK